MASVAVTVNGWGFERDDAGFWAVSGSVRMGPYVRPPEARQYALDHTAPKQAPRDAPK